MKIHAHNKRVRIILIRDKQGWSAITLEGELNPVTY